MSTSRTTHLHASDLEFLEARGAFSRRGARTFSRSAVLQQQMQLLLELLVHYDPRRTSAMPEVMFQLVARLLPEPWLIKPSSVEHLALRLQETPNFAARVREAGVDPAELVATVAALGFGEKVALLDHALQHQAPAASKASEGES